jgi:hypothetical protein
MTEHTYTLLFRVLRAVHIYAAIVLVGSIIFNTGILMPALRRIHRRIRRWSAEDRRRTDVDRRQRDFLPRRHRFHTRMDTGRVAAAIFQRLHRRPAALLDRAKSCLSKRFDYRPRSKPGASFGVASKACLRYFPSGRLNPPFESKGALVLLSAHWPEDTPRYAQVPLKTVGDTTIYPIAASAPERAALVSKSGKLTYGEPAERARALGKALRGLIERGARVAIALDDPASC